VLEWVTVRETGLISAHTEMTGTAFEAFRARSSAVVAFELRTRATGRPRGSTVWAPGGKPDEPSRAAPCGSRKRIYQQPAPVLGAPVTSAERNLGPGAAARMR
jgi:hypothetical protein